MLKIRFSFFIAAIISLLSCQDENDRRGEPSPEREGFSLQDAGNEFVISRQDKFYLKGNEFRFVGTNNYYLHYKDNQMIDDVLDQATDMGLKVIRMWAFMDGAKAGDDSGYDIQPAAGVFTPRAGRKSGLERIDYVLMRAQEKGIKIVLVLTNNWDDFGGMNQYVKWEPTARRHDDFYTNIKIKNVFKSFIVHLVNRENSYTKIKYKDDPTIMTWELANEPRCESDKLGNTLLNWADEMSAFIKSIAPKQMVAVGDEGFFNRQAERSWAYNGYTGVDFDRLIRLKNIDYGTYHLYPDHWGDDFKRDAINSGVKWIRDHIRVGKDARKPVVLEEYGIVRESATNRNAAYDAWKSVIYNEGGSAAMFWILSGIETGANADSGGLYPDYDGFRITNDGGSTSQLIKKYAKLMGTSN